MVIELLSERSKVYKDVDPYQVSAYVNEHVGNHNIVVYDCGARAALSHRRLADLDLCHIRYGSMSRVTTSSLRDKFHLQILLSGSCVQRILDTQRALVPGDIVIINPDELVDFTYSQDCEKFILKIPMALMGSVCQAQCWLLPQEGLRFESRVYKLANVEGMGQLLSLICHEVEGGSGLQSVKEHYAQIITRKVLTCFAANLDLQGGGVRRHSLKRAMSYIDDHLKEGITPEELARAANLSLRSLYALFDECVGEPPRRHVVRKKLEKIQAALLNPNFPARSVTELALDYGFTHLGRFSAEYKSYFAELPSQTLRRARNTLISAPASQSSVISGSRKSV